jgi:hypothetical protein
MSIPLSGINVTTDFTFASGVGADLINEFSPALVAAGWSSVVAGSGFDLTSATTPQGLNVVIEVRQAIANTALGATFKDTSTSPVQLVVSRLGDYRIVANPYQFFMYILSRADPDGGGNAGELMGGVPFIPSFLVAGTTEAWWARGSGQVPLANSETFRTSVTPDGRATWAFNGQVTAASLNTENPVIVPPRSVAQPAMTEFLWYDGSVLDAEALIAWGKTSAASDRRVIGILWDTVVIWDEFPIDDEQTFGSHTWTNITKDTAIPSIWVIKE